MLKKLMIGKDFIITIPESLSSLGALEILSDNNLQVAPIVDASNNLYRGSINLFHIYEHAYHHPEDDLSKIPVTHFLKGTNDTIYINQTIYHLLFAMQGLPYVAVLNDQRTFIGIIREQTLEQYLAEAWAVDKSETLLSIRARGYRGEFRKISRLVNRYSDMNTLMTFERSEFNTESFILVALPAYLDQVTIRKLVRHLKRNRYDVQTFEI